MMITGEQRRNRKVPAVQRRACRPANARHATHKSLYSEDFLLRPIWLRSRRRANGRQKSRAARTSARVTREVKGPQRSREPFVPLWTVVRIDEKAARHRSGDVKARATFLRSRFSTALPLVTELGLPVTATSSPHGRKRGEWQAENTLPTNDTMSYGGAYWTGQRLKMNRRSNRSPDQGLSQWRPIAGDRPGPFCPRD
jgi:hypothetical protein